MNEHYFGLVNVSIRRCCAFAVVVGTVLKMMNAFHSLIKKTCLFVLVDLMPRNSIWNFKIVSNGREQSCLAS